jgi:Icc-related predicted phosphoesterase
MKKTVIFLTFLAILLGGCVRRSSQCEGSIAFIVTSDMGRHGVSEQQRIAALLSLHTELADIDFLVVAGDPIHDDGVTSVDDEEWKVKIENVYASASLHAIPWYVVSGNHEYNGSVPAILAYSDVSGRWNAPARYFSFTKKIGACDEECLFIFIDTTPLIDKYRYDEDRSDAGQQDMAAQLEWIENTLASSSANWKIVIGHHPVYAKTNKEVSERTDMQERVGVLLEKHDVDFYICGHIHNFQHISPTGSNVHYVVNSSASQSREVHEIDEVEGVIFANPDPGYSVFTVSADSVVFSFVNHTGETVYRSANKEGNASK